MASPIQCPNVALTLFLTLFFQTRIFSEVIIEESCNTNIALPTSKIFTVSNWTALRMRGTCSINVTADPPHPLAESNNQIMFSILNLQIDETDITRDPNERTNIIGEENPCPGFRLDIINAESSERITPSHGLCKSNLHTKRFESDDDKATIVLTYNVTSNTTTSHKDAFRLLAVRFHTNPCDDDEEFECDNQRCVSLSLKCNGENDCGDESDETDGCLTSIPVLIIIVVISAIFLIAVIAAAVFMFKRSAVGGGGWGEARLMAGASGINVDPSETQHVTRPAHTRKPADQTYGTTSLDLMK